MSRSSAGALGWTQSVPDHWRVVPLRYVAKVGTGHTPDRNNSTYWKECNIPWVTTPDVTKRADALAPLWDTEQKISALGMANSAAQLHPAGTVMLSRTASVGYSVLIGKPMATTQAFVTWTPGPNLDSRYLLLVLRAMHQEWDRLAYGSTHRTIYMPDLESLRIPLPPLEEQRRIADFLNAETSRLEELSGLTSLQVASLKNRLTAAFSDATTGTNESKVKKTGIFWMPEIGESMRLLKIAREFRTGSGTTPKSDNGEYFDGGVPWVNSGDVRDRAIASTGKTVSRVALSDYSVLQVYQPGSLVVAMYGATMGRVGLLGISACVNQACCVLIETGSLRSEYVFYWIRAHRAEIMNLAIGGGQPNLSQEAIRGLQVPAPSLEEQDRIVRDLRVEEDRTEVIVSALNQRLALIAEKRRALITAAVTGQLDVTTARSGVGS